MNLLQQMYIEKYIDISKAIYRYFWYIDISLPSLYTDDTIMARTYFLWISTAGLFWAVKKWIPTRTSQGAITRNYSSIFNTVFCTCLWSDCHVIFTVLQETQKLYLHAVSHWLVHKTLRKKKRNLILRRLFYSQIERTEFCMYSQSTQTAYCKKVLQTCGNC